MEKVFLSEYLKRAQDSHNWISFDPEKRGQQVIQEFEQVLNDDLTEIEAATDDQKQQYIDKFKSLFANWLNAKSRCISAAITGPSNFPTKKAEKANRGEQNAYEIFQHFRVKAKKAILKSLQPAKTPATELQRLMADLSSRIELQEKMKKANQIIKAAKGKKCTLELMHKIGLSEKLANEIQQPDFAGRVGFASFLLQNNLARIKGIQNRIATVEAKVDMNNRHINFEGGYVVINYDYNRVQIHHDEKPSREVISSIKAANFHWSRHCTAWQRILTTEALKVTEKLIGVEIF